MGKGWGYIMNILSPSILAADFWNLGDQIEIVKKSGAQYLHIDVMDGVFVPSISFGLTVIASIRKHTDIFFDVHLMITEPKRYINEFAESGANMLTFHVEATEDVMGTIAAIHAKGMKAGIAIKPATPVEDILPYLDLVDMVLVMTVEPGFGGQKYMDFCTDKIRQVREAINEKGLSVDVQIDGGVNPDNVSIPLEAGANVIVAGSSVFKNNAEENIRKFLEAMKAFEN